MNVQKPFPRTDYAFPNGQSLYSKKYAMDAVCRFNAPLRYRIIINPAPYKVKKKKEAFHFKNVKIFKYF